MPPHKSSNYKLSLIKIKIDGLKKTFKENLKNIWIKSAF